jgi:peptidoglycan/LPS O-acetylase OafA/YrhL
MTYRPEIDGLRAVAVLGVLLFHAGFTTISGGFVGVDVFFVISGYLITGNIIKDCRSGSFSFYGFYGRRVRRIFPALIVVLAFSLAAGWLIFLPLHYELLSKEAIAGALLVPNFLFWSQTGYFDSDAISKPLLHLWSLGVEEQFYLAWPLALFLIATRRLLLIGFLTFVTALSFALYVTITPTDAALAFYLPQFRIWELSLGALIACAGPLSARTVFRSALSVSGICAIVAAMVLFDPHSPSPGYLALPALGAAAVVWAGRDTIAAKALSWRPVVYVGLISYPLYLWHWPLLSFAHYQQITGHMALPAILAASFLLAVGTYEFIEKHVRSASVSSSAPRLAVTLAGVAAVGAAVFISGGAGFRYQGSGGAVASIVAAMKYDYAAPGRLYSCWLVEKGPQELAEECLAPAAGKGILIWGDSHAALMYAGVQKVFPEIPVWQATRSSCPFYGGDGKCGSLNATAVRFIQERRPETVILFAAWENYSEDWATGSPSGSTLKAALDRLRELKIPNLIVLGPIPYWKPTLPALAYAAWKKSGEIPLRANGAPKPTERVDREIKAISKSSGASFVSLRDILCNAEGCLVHVPGKAEDLISFDREHLTVPGAEFLASRILGHVAD